MLYGPETLNHRSKSHKLRDLLPLSAHRLSSWLETVGLLCTSMQHPSMIRLSRLAFPGALQDASAHLQNLRHFSNRFGSTITLFPILHFQGGISKPRWPYPTSLEF